MIVVVNIGFLRQIHKTLQKKEITTIKNDELKNIVKEIREIVSKHQDDPFSITGLLHFNIFRNPESLNNLNEKFKKDGNLIASKFMYEYLP